VIRVAWRQFRTNAFVAGAALSAAAIVVLATGPSLRHVFVTTVAGCTGRADCGPAIDSFLQRDVFLQRFLDAILKAAPAVIGIFWGAPLVAREIETGTFRLAWTQSITRTRWLATRLAVVGLASVAATGLLTLAIAWWNGPLDKAMGGRFQFFDVRGVTPVAYALAAFAIGVGAGVVIRRTLPAMATALGAWFGLRLAFTFWIRPRLLPVTHGSVSLRYSEGFGFLQSPAGLSFVVTRPNLPDALVVSNQIVDTAGHAASPQTLHNFIVQLCPQLVAQAANPQPDRLRVAPGGGKDLFDQCVQQISTKFHLAVTYQPHSRFWPLQWSEAAIFGALAFALCALSVWWVRRRIG
jgi:hypothetical protein